MKIIITESQHKYLVGKLSPTLMRRLTADDFDYIEHKIPSMALYEPANVSFETFVNNVVGYTITEFVAERKGDEIETFIDPDYGEMFYESSFNKVVELYKDLTPLLIEMYRDKLYELWKKYD